MISKVSCILISAPFEDHFHETSLMRFDRNTLVLTSKPSERKLKKLGFNNIETLRAGTQKNIGDLSIKAHDAGFPYNYLWTFSFEIIQGDKVLYFESHIVIDPLMSGLSPNQLLTDEELEEAEENCED